MSKPKKARKSLYMSVGVIVISSDESDDNSQDNDDVLDDDVIFIAETHPMRNNGKLFLRYIFPYIKIIYKNIFSRSSATTSRFTSRSVNCEL